MRRPPAPPSPEIKYQNNLAKIRNTWTLCSIICMPCEMSSSDAGVYVFYMSSASGNWTPVLRDLAEAAGVGVVDCDGGVHVYRGLARILIDHRARKHNLVPSQCKVLERNAEYKDTV
jgi:hypothetical protein